MINIVLVHPEIPQNTGNIGRICVNMDATLHLVKPLGFEITQKEVKRAGLDYWDKLELKVWDSLEALLQSIDLSKNSCYFATTKTDRNYFEAPIQTGDYIFFGSESKGLPKTLLEANATKCITIPMGKNGRSLNLSVSVGVIAYDAIRQNINEFKR
jgi:tRNA (cytidine/uridine-2'-O-)-methyltransferase